MLTDTWYPTEANVSGIFPALPNQYDFL